MDTDGHRWTLTPPLHRANDHESTRSPALPLHQVVSWGAEGIGVHWGGRRWGSVFICGSLARAFCAFHATDLQIAAAVV